MDAHQLSLARSFDDVIAELHTTANYRVTSESALKLLMEAKRFVILARTVEESEGSLHIIKDDGRLRGFD